MADDTSTSKRQRVSKACEQCRRKKVKCDGGSPVCGNCIALQIQCTYKETTKKRGPPKGYIEAIEGRLHRLEALLGNIVQENDPRFQAIIAEMNAPLETAYGELVRPRPMQRTTIAGFDEAILPGHATSMSEFRDMSEVPANTDQSTMATVDSVNDNLCNLSIDESGQLRYYGRSSGFYMLQGSKNFHNGSFQFGSEDYDRATGQPFPASRLVVNPFETPPDDLSEHLLDLYFKYFYPFIPLLHKKSFMDALESRDRPPSLLLLNAIYAVASRVSSDPRVCSDPSQPDTAGDVFFERARLLLDYELNNFQVSTVQSLLLMSSHQNGALRPTRGWIYSGMAFRMAQNLGLHRNCDNWNLTEAQKQERKRVFFCCFVIDRLTCAMHGRSPMIDERDYDTPYPTEHDEDDQERTPRIMDNFLSLIKLCEILGDVLRDLYMVKGRKQLSVMATPDSVISTLDKALNQWMAKLPPSLRYKPPNTRLAEKAPAPTLELCQTHMLFYTTLILLHRPFIPGPTQSIAPSVYPSASICTFAANKILDIAESLMAEGRLANVNNYSVYFMFTAGIIFIYNAASSDSLFAFEAKISINKIMRTMDEVEKTWITSARHCNILGELAGLRDINLSGVDDTHRRRSNSHATATPPAAIAVPNSPDMSPAQDYKEIGRATLINHDMMDEKYARHYAILGDRSPTRANQSCEMSQNSTPSPYHLTPRSPQNASSSEQHRSPPPMSVPSTQPAPFPVAFPPTTAAMLSHPGRPFDPLATAFWEMPMSFDFDDWNSYFENQSSDRVNGKPFHPQATSLPMDQGIVDSPMNPSISGPTSSANGTPASHSDLDPQGRPFW